MGELPKLGTDAGWCLAFRSSRTPDRARADVLLDRSRFYADVQVELPGGVEPGSFVFAVEGVPEDEAQWLVENLQDLRARLYLYWRDTPLSLFSPLGALGGGEPSEDALVAVLKPRAIRRRAGDRRYELVIECRDYVYDLLTRRVGKDNAWAAADDVQSEARNFLEAVGVAVADAPVPPPAPSGGATANLGTLPGLGSRGIDYVDAFNRRLEALYPDRRGLGMFLVRDGKVHLGPNRLRDMKTRVLTQETGLVHAENAGYVEEDPNRNPELNAFAEGPTRERLKAVLLGRPDIKPGDFVELPRAPTPAGEPTMALRGTLYYVLSVQHRLSRKEAFVTTVHGLEAPSPEQAWLRVSRPVADEGSAESSVAKRLRSGPSGTARLQSENKVGEVRAATTRAGDVAAQRTVIWRGLSQGADPRRSVTEEVDPNLHATLLAVPYATPFAWGKCGLVLPRYPGTRVFVAHHDGDTYDPVDVGALWKDGDAPDSDPGDWWLILPVAPAQPESVADDAAPQKSVEKATNDLTARDGSRTIEVGKLTIRVGADPLKTPGTRPQVSSDGDVVIEHQTGSKIVIAQDGSITVHSEKALTLEAKEKLVLEADSVEVRVTNTMDVSKK